MQDNFLLIFNQIQRFYCNITGLDKNFLFYKKYFVKNKNLMTQKDDQPTFGHVAFYMQDDG